MSTSDSLISFADYSRLIASIVRLMMSAWQAFGAQKHTRQISCFRASAASLLISMLAALRASSSCSASQSS